MSVYEFVGANGVDVSVVSGPGSVSTSIADPAGLAEGDLLLYAFWALRIGPDAGLNVSETEPGWTSNGASHNVGAWWYAVGYRFAGATEPASMGFTLTMPAGAGTRFYVVGLLAAYRNVAEYAATPDHGTYASGGTDSLSPSVPTQANALGDLPTLLVYITGGIYPIDSGWDITTSDPITERFRFRATGHTFAGFPQDIAVALFDEQWDDAASYPARADTWSGLDDTTPQTNRAILIRLDPTEMLLEAPVAAGGDVWAWVG